MSAILEKATTYSLTKDGKFGILPVYSEKKHNPIGISLPVYFENEKEVQKFKNYMSKIFDVEFVESHGELHIGLIDRRDLILEKRKEFKEEVIMRARPRLINGEIVNCIEIISPSYERSPTKYEKSIIDNILRNSTISEKLKKHLMEKEGFTENKALGEISKIAPTLNDYDWKSAPL